MTHLLAYPLLYFHGQVLDKDTCMYAVSQGAMAVECRNSDPFTLSLLSQIHHPETVIQCVAERAFLKKLVCTALLLLMPIVAVACGSIIRSALNKLR